MPFTIITGGSYVSDGTNKKIPLPSSADYFFTINKTQMATTQATGRCVRGEWTPDFAALDGYRWKKANNTSAISIDTFATSTASDGFKYVTTAPTVEAAVTGTAITNAGPAVVTMTNTYSNGDRVRLYGTTGMKQIAGMDFTISSVSGSGFTLLGLDASAFAAPATAVIARRISNHDAVEPRFLYITGISQATNGVVTVSTAHEYVVGQLITFSIPQGFGMTQLQGLTGKIVAVGTYTMTVDIDTSAFTAFEFPASSAVPTAPAFATLAPAGQRTQFNSVTGVQTGYNFDYVPFHTGDFVPYMLICAGTQSPGGSDGDVIEWYACQTETGFQTPSNP